METRSITFLHEELGVHKTAETVCVQNAIDVSLELGECPGNLYDIMEERGMGKKTNIYKQMSRVAPKLWKQGAGIFHKEGCEYESPLSTLHDILYYLSDKKIW